MKQPLERITVDTIVGTLIIAGDATHIHTVKFGGASAAGETSHGKVSSAALGMARAQLKEYFSGSRRRFDLPLLPVGTDFQKRVWRALAMSSAVATSTSSTSPGLIALSSSRITPETKFCEMFCIAKPIATAKIEELIDELKAKYTIAIVTHSMQQAARVSDYTAFLYLGELIEYGPTQGLFTNPIEERTEAYVTGRFG